MPPDINHVITGSTLKKGSIIRLKSYNPQVIKERK